MPHYGVFVDPSEYRRNNFDFKGERLSAMADVACKDWITFLHTYVSVSEMKGLIQEHVAKACSQLKKSDLSVLKPIDDDRLEIIRNPPDADELSAKLIEKFDEHLVDGECEVLPVSDVDSGLIFNAYFNNKPPFDDQKKKAEFPDAFTLQRLVMWAMQNETVVYVVGRDDDLKRVCTVCDQLQYFEKIEAVLDNINQAEELVQRLHVRPQELIDQLERFVYKYFPDREFYPLYNDHGEVENIGIAAVDIGEIYALEVSEGYVRSEAEAEVAYSADVSYEDFNTGFYDRETGRHHMTEYVNLEVDDAKSKITVRFNFALDESHHSVASEISIVEDTITVEEEDRGDYGMYK